MRKDKRATVSSAKLSPSLSKCSGQCHVMSTVSLLFLFFSFSLWGDEGWWLWIHLFSSSVAGIKALNDSVCYRTYPQSCFFSVMSVVFKGLW